MHSMLLERYRRHYVRIGGNTQENGQARLVEIRLVALGSVDCRQIESQPLHPWAIMRRLLTEARDRCYLRGE
jgi:hypothetical protein